MIFHALNDFDLRMTSPLLFFSGDVGSAKLSIYSLYSQLKLPHF